MIGQLDLETGLQDLANLVGEQAAIAGQLDAIAARPAHEKLRRLAQHGAIPRLNRPPLHRHQVPALSCRHRPAHW